MQGILLNFKHLITDWKQRLQALKRLRKTYFLCLARLNFTTDTSPLSLSLPVRLPPSAEGRGGTESWDQGVLLLLLLPHSSTSPSSLIISSAPVTGHRLWSLQACHQLCHGVIPFSGVYRHFLSLFSQRCHRLLWLVQGHHRLP